MIASFFLTSHNRWCTLGCMKFVFGKTFAIFFLIAAVALSFGVGFSVGKNQSTLVPIEGITNLEAGKPQGVDFSLFWDTWRNLQAKYVHSDAFDYQKMVYGAISGMVSSIGDPYTVFMNPQEAKTFMEDVSGSFEGVGMELGKKNKQLQVIAPLPETPAAKAGIRAGDQILKINDAATEDMAVDKAVSLIRGPKGTKVTLSIFRDGFKAAKDFVLEREVIQVPSLKWEMKDNAVAYIHLYQFSEKAGNDFSKAASEIMAQHAKKIVLDLRNDPGGYLEVSQDIAGWFLERGQTVVIESFGADKKQNIYKAQGNALFNKTPIVILINEGSASASEILAGALKDNRGVLLVGTKSFGKGSVQELSNLQGGSSLKVTIADWLTPKGISISKKGLTPDVEVKMTDKDFEQGKDPQLEKALERIQNL